MALYHFSAKVLSRRSRNTVGDLAYRAGCKLYDEKTGLSFNYQSKPVEHVELLLPKDAPQWAMEIQKLMEVESLNKLMQKEEHLLTKIFVRVSNELEAMGAVSKKAFWQVADHFLGINREKEIRVTPDLTQSSIREEVRATEVLKTPAKAPQNVDAVNVFNQLTQQCTQKL